MLKDLDKNERPGKLTTSVSPSLRDENTLSLLPFVFIRNLPPACTACQIKTLLSTVSSPTRIKLVRDKLQKRSRFAFAIFRDEDAVHGVVRQLNGTLLQGRRIHLERGLPTSASTVTTLARKRTETTGLVAKSLLGLKEDNCVAVELSPPLKFSPERIVDFMNCILPKSMKVVKVYHVPHKTCRWYIELPGVREAASLALAWKRVEIPMRALKGYLKDSEKPLESTANKTVVMSISCVVTQVEKVAVADTCNTSQKNPAPLVIRNLSYRTSEQQLFHILKGYGLIRKLRMSDPKPSDASSTPAPHGGYAFVSYKTLDAATTAMNELKGKQLCGRTLDVTWGVGDKTSRELSKGLLRIPVPNFAKRSPWASN